ncbi:MAG: CRTAC1 family protein [Pirellulales bacterium]
MTGRVCLALLVLLCLMLPEVLRLARDQDVPVLRMDHGKSHPGNNEGEEGPFIRDGQFLFLREISDEVGLDFQHAVGPPGTYFTPEINGAGGALFDYDNDGDLDIYLVNSGRSPKAEAEFPPGTRIENRLFQQQSDGTLIDVTAESGLGDTGYGIGCAVGDVDNDGHLDVYVTNYGPDRLFRNLGDGTFSDITDLAGIANPDWGTCAAFFDYDRDGWLDLMVVNFTADPVHGHSVACGFLEGRVSYCGPHRFVSTADRLFHNDGVQTDLQGRRSVRFTDVTASAGLGEALTSGFGLVCADFNGDRWPDIYIASDMSPNRLWINRADGTFRDEAIPRGAAINRHGLSQGSMGVAAGDIDGDGDFDLIATNLTFESAVLYLNDGAGYFVDATRQTGLEMPSRRHTGWGVGLLDLDHDGDLDLPMANGFVVPRGSGFPPHGEDAFVLRTEKIKVPGNFWREYADTNILLFNDGNGEFRDVSPRGGDFGAAIGSARALIYGDLDDDGDLDFLVTNCGERARLYRNEIPKSGHWLAVRAFDPRLHRDAYGAEIIVTAGGRRLVRLLSPCSSYLASNDVRVHFGLGPEPRYEEIFVRWPDGLDERFPAGSADQTVMLRRGEGRLVMEKGS